MAERIHTADPDDKGYPPPKPVEETPLPDARSEENEAIGPSADPATEIPVGIQQGQTTRGSYGTHPATGAGRYVDHTGTFATRPVAQPGTDQAEEPDTLAPPID